MSIIKGKTNIVAGFGGTKRCIGEVYFSQSSLATDNPGALPGWTGEYYENGKTLFPDLYNFVKAHSELQVTKAQYDSAIATYGECPKYVVDENTAQTSLRLPKYANYIKMANNIEGITQKGAGLPTVKAIANTAAGVSVPFSKLPNYAKAVQNSEGYTLMTGGSISTDASLSYVENDSSLNNSIYGASDTVQPAHTTLYPWISAYTSAIPASTAQAAEFTNALTGKANTDLSNVLANIDYVVESKVPTESDPSWYRKYKSGWIEQGGELAASTSQVLVHTYLKPFTGKYVLTTGIIATDNYPKSVQLHNITETSFSYKIATDGGTLVADSFFWRAEGQGGGNNI